VFTDTAGVFLPIYLPRVVLNVTADDGRDVKPSCHSRSSDFRIRTLCLPTNQDSMLAAPATEGGLAYARFFCQGRTSAGYVNLGAGARREPPDIRFE
jgi:hypothetical protein